MDFFTNIIEYSEVGGGQGWGNIIKYQLEYVPTIQLGFLPSKFLNIEKMLTKLSIHKNGY